MHSAIVYLGAEIALKLVPSCQREKGIASTRWTAKMYPTSSIFLLHPPVLRLAPSPCISSTHARYKTLRHLYATGSFRYGLMVYGPQGLLRHLWQLTRAHFFHFFFFLQHGKCYSVEEHRARSFARHPRFWTLRKKLESMEYCVRLRQETWRLNRLANNIDRLEAR